MTSLSDVEVVFEAAGDLLPLSAYSGAIAVVAAVAEEEEVVEEQQRMKVEGMCDLERDRENGVYRIDRGRRRQKLSRHVPWVCRVRDVREGRSREKMVHSDLDECCCGGEEDED
ncbi:hypothetical protein L1987_60741 [Smallanthus sonchifolius]|uniref:Uncharacterized protein n=1 Tax=Smallanthus sonchifolius TaxID=185202 RepID=A0ACB9D8X3_9ASTR|nr:hypothetical protein L1987_60741 [Smallanthus sonchifolius]